MIRKVIQDNKILQPSATLLPPKKGSCRPSVVDSEEKERLRQQRLAFSIQDNQTAEEGGHR